MATSDDFTLDCRTCVAAHTTACAGCVVQHLLANDAGPIDFVPTRRPAPVSETQRVVELFINAGLLDDDPHFVSSAEFESGRAPQMTI